MARADFIGNASHVEWVGGAHLYGRAQERVPFFTTPPSAEFGPGTVIKTLWLFPRREFAAGLT